MTDNDDRPIFRIEDIDGNLLSRDAYMMSCNFPGNDPDCPLIGGDLIRLSDGIWQINEDLIPWEFWGD